MFQDMISSLRHNNIPDNNSLAPRLQIALTKKEGVLNIPYLMRSADPKINPLSQHILWGFILTQNSEGVARMLDLLILEKADEKRERLGANTANNLIVEYLDKFRSLPTELTCQNYLEKLITNLSVLKKFQF